MEDYSNLKRKAAHYKEILNNTTQYRVAWKNGLKQQILSQLQEMVKEAELEAELEKKEEVENLEAIELSLGQTRSGIFEKVNPEVQRHLIKHNGSLVYQQLFNGKIMVMITLPHIDGYEKPRPPLSLGIYRPEELKPPFILRHMEEFIKEITNWEDYDDDEPSQQTIGFNMNFLDNVAGASE